VWNRSESTHLEPSEQTKHDETKQHYFSILSKIITITNIHNNNKAIFIDPLHNNNKNSNAQNFSPLKIQISIPKQQQEEEDGKFKSDSEESR
jgi:hypothetical protein